MQTIHTDVQAHTLNRTFEHVVQAMPCPFQQRDPEVLRYAIDFLREPMRDEVTIHLHVQNTP